MVENTHYLDQGIKRTIELDGKEFLYFSGTSYLGINQDPTFIQSISENLIKWGSNYGQSRLNNIQLSIFNQFESFFAQGAQAPEAAVLSSGFLAGMAINQLLSKQNEYIWAAPDTHPAILPAGIKSPTQFNFTQWIERCLNQSKSLNPSKILILGNAVDAFNSEFYNYDWVQEIAQKHETTLLIDDSHAFGVMGQGVFGTYHQWVHSTINLVVSGSLGKGLSIPAGIILGNHEIISSLKSTPLYGGASPGSPAHLEAFLQNQKLYKEKQQWLFKACDLFYNEMKEFHEIEGKGNYPVFRLKNDSWVKELEKRGILISSFRYPTKSSPLINRIIISAFHTREDLSLLISILKDLKSNEN